MGRFFLLVVLLAAGLGAAWGVCRFTTPVYESQSEIEVTFSRATEGGFEENLNTSLSAWRSDHVLHEAVWQFRTNVARTSSISDVELINSLADVEIARVPRARLVSVTARTAAAESAADLANAYAKAIASSTERANAARAEAAAAQIHAEVERRRQTDERLARELLSFRTANAAGTQTSERRLLEQNLERTTADILEQEKRVREAERWASFLEMARTRPEGLGAFPATVPESSEVRRAYKAWQDARNRLAKLRTRYTEEHPEVEVAKNLLIAVAKQFAEVLVGAAATADSELAAAQNQLKAFRRTAGRLRAELEGMELRTTEAHDGLERLQQEKKVSRDLYEEALRKENEIRVSIGQDADRVRVVRTAAVPSKPVSPNPTVAYSLGVGVPTLLWLLLGLVWPSAHRRRRRCVVVR